MKNLRYIFYVSLLVFLYSSCNREEYLDFQSRGVVVPSKIEDYRSLLDQTSNLGNGLSQGFSDKHGSSIFVTDNQLVNANLVSGFNVTRAQVNSYLFEATWFSSLEDDPQWNLYYNQIYIANIIIEGLNTVTDGTAEEIAELTAEAKLHRAYAYFNLVNLYGLHYNPASADTDLGVPIREGIELIGAIDLTRASVKAVYDLIISDVTESLTALKDLQSPNFTFRPSKAGAYGFLAKVYMYQNNYTEALQAATNALSIYDVIRDINNDPISANNELLRVLPIATDDDQIIWYKNSPNFLFATESLISLYEENDVRNEWYGEIIELYGDQVDGFAYGGDFDNANTADGISTPDVYLIRAECNARLGNIANANTDLNALREKRFITGTYSPLNITDPTELLNMVKNERRREMVRGTERTFDIKRYNLFDDDNISLTHTLGNRTETLEANSKNWAFPIAPKYIQQNPEIVQNPRD